MASHMHQIIEDQKYQLGKRNKRLILLDGLLNVVNCFITSSPELKKLLKGAPFSPERKQANPIKKENIIKANIFSLDSNL
jgi:hypothetical protein